MKQGLHIQEKNKVNAFKEHKYILLAKKQFAECEGNPYLLKIAHNVPLALWEKDNNPLSSIKSCQM